MSSRDFLTSFVFYYSENSTLQHFCKRFFPLALRRLFLLQLCNESHMFQLGDLSRTEGLSKEGGYGIDM